MALGKDYEGQDCSLARALETLGERWTLLIVRDAFYGVRRYSDFRAHLDTPRAVLSERLHRLTEAGVLDRIRYSDSPPRDEYVLTEAGKELWPVLFSLASWADRNLPVDGPCRIFRHSSPCGLELGRGGACPRCGAIPVEDIEITPGPGVNLLRTDTVSVELRTAHRLLVPLGSARETETREIGA
jgi:DNA-binding HxlR family transcriptional regulator